jgi:RNA polymerase sigma-B factor
MESNAAVTARIGERERERGQASESTRRHEAMLFRTYFESGSAAIREELVTRFMPLARSLARRYAGGSEPLDDLIQVANLGLVKAVDGFDPRLGRRFTTYAVPTILGELRRHFRDRVWIVRLPRGLGELTLELDRATEALAEQLGRSPTPAEIADELGISVERAVEGLVADHARRISSLDAPRLRSNATSMTVGDTVADRDLGFDRVEADLAAQATELEDREREVLRLRFHDGLTQREIGARIGVSQMQVSRVSRRALRKLLNSVRGEASSGVAAA